MKGSVIMTAKKRGLGKGLSALIQDKEKVETLVNESKLDIGEVIEEISLDEITPKKDQPRKIFNKESYKEIKFKVFLTKLKIKILLKPLKSAIQ